MDLVKLRESINLWSRQTPGTICRETTNSGRSAFELTWRTPSGSEPYIAVVPESDSLIVQHGVIGPDSSRCIAGTLGMSGDLDLGSQLSRLKTAIDTQAQARGQRGAQRKEWYAAIPPLIKTASLKH